MRLREVRSSATGILEIFFRWFLIFTMVHTSSSNHYRVFRWSGLFQTGLWADNAFLAVWNRTQRRKTSANVQKKTCTLKRSDVLSVNLVHCFLFCCVKTRIRYLMFTQSYVERPSPRYIFITYINPDYLSIFSLLVHLSVTVRCVLLCFCRSLVYPVQQRFT